MTLRGRAWLAVVLVAAAVVIVPLSRNWLEKPAGAAITVDDAEARIIGAGTSIGVTLTLTNRGVADDRLVAISSPAASAAMIYAMSCPIGEAGPDETAAPQASRAAGSQPQQLTSVVVPAGTSVVIGGDVEVVLSGITSALGRGSNVLVTFEFREAASVTLAVPIVGQQASVGESGCG
jgi:copper(I)-binding protein